MRTAFFSTLADLAETDDRVVLLTGDLGFGVADQFAKRFPSRMINVGVAEQNMTGLATGLALAGKVVFTYSIGNFPTLRCLEQIRNGPCYHRLNVTIVTVGGGLSYGSLGMTHHATEDLAVMRALPNITVLAPGDPVEAQLATRASAATDGPVYLRLGRAGEPAVHQSPPPFAIGRAIVARAGTDMTIISTGGMLSLAADVSDALLREGIRCRVLSMHTVKPIDQEAVIAAARETPLVVTLEEHSLIGGLGSAVAEVLADHDQLTARLRRVGLPSTFVSEAGSRDYLCEKFGLTKAAILSTIRTALTGASH